MSAMPAAFPTSPTAPMSTSPREPPRPDPLRSHRPDLTVLELSGAVTQSSRQRLSKHTPQAMAGAWPPRGASACAPSASSTANGHGGDAVDGQPQLSPLSQPMNPRMATSEQTDAGYFDGERRPSVASIATASSQGSQSSVGMGFHRKLHSFFGDEYRERASPQPLETNQLTSTNGGRSSSQSHHRNNSIATTSTAEGRTTPPSSRPRTPVPSSEVTPWLYQDSEVSAQAVFAQFVCFQHLWMVLPVCSEPGVLSSSWLVSGAANRHLFVSRV